MSGERENKLVSFIMNGRRTNEPEEQWQETEDPPEQDSATTDLIAEKLDSIEKTLDGLKSAAEPAGTPDLGPLESAVLELREKTEEYARDLGAGIKVLAEKEPEKQDLSPYMTSREQMKTIIAAVERRDAEVADKAFARAMEQIAAMREDFRRLCCDIRDRLDVMSAEEVLSSFEAYRVDLENILFDGGVYIGPFPYEKLNTIHQRIVGVVPTADPDLNGKVAERLTDGYKLGNRVLLKERVAVYRLSEYMADAEKNPGPEQEAASETVSETVSEGETKQEEKE